MSPNEIGVILHYYSHADDYPQFVRPQNDYWQGLIKSFMDADLLSSCADGKRLYQLTFRGECFVALLLSVMPPTAQDIRTAFEARGAWKATGDFMKAMGM